MRFSRFMLALVPLSLAACADDAERTEEMADSIRAEAERADAGQALTGDTIVADAADAAEGMRATVVLNEVGGSDVTGEATIVPAAAANQTTVTVRLNSPGEAGAVHQGHIHQGTCDQIGDVVVPLEPITTSGGTGSSTATAAIDAMTVMDGQHVVVFHQAGGQPGTPVVCGEIPGHMMM